MSKEPICNCPPGQNKERAAEQKGEICSQCGGRRLAPDQLLPSPAKRNTPQSALTEFPALRLETDRPLETPARLEQNRAERAQLTGNASGDQRRQSHDAEQKKITRLLGIAILLWALFSLLPGGAAWRVWLGDWSAGSFPIWIPLFAAFGSAPLCLGLLLMQVPDWCTLKSAAVGLLATACGYAFAATLFGLSGPNSRWLAWLDFPLSDAAAATLWCSCMLVLAAALSLICFLEGQRWHRVEQLFTELQKSSDIEAQRSGS